MIKSKSGFTIVELLIVIAVIAILAAITVVAYNGIQQRAVNTKTTTALSSWIKALKLYKAENGRWPAGAACLGEGYGYGVSGAESSGFQCRQDGAGGINENTVFHTMMKPYIGNSLPTPGFVTWRSSETVWRRGISYMYGGGNGTEVYMMATLAGSLPSCPSTAGEDPDSRTVTDNITYCFYMLGSTTDS